MSSTRRVCSHGHREHTNHERIHTSRVRALTPVLDFIRHLFPHRGHFIETYNTLRPPQSLLQPAHGWREFRADIAGPRQDRGLSASPPECRGSSGRFLRLNIRIGFDRWRRGGSRGRGCAAAAEHQAISNITIAPTSRFARRSIGLTVRSTNVCAGDPFSVEGMDHLPTIRNHTFYSYISGIAEKN